MLLNAVVHSAPTLRDKVREGLDTALTESENHKRFVDFFSSSPIEIFHSEDLGITLMQAGEKRLLIKAGAEKVELIINPSLNQISDIDDQPETAYYRLGFPDKKYPVEWSAFESEAEKNQRESDQFFAFLLAATGAKENTSLSIVLPDNEEEESLPNETVGVLLQKIFALANGEKLEINNSNLIILQEITDYLINEVCDAEYDQNYQQRVLQRLAVIFDPDGNTGISPKNIAATLETKDLIHASKDVLVSHIVLQVILDQLHPGLYRVTQSEDKVAIEKPGSARSSEIAPIEVFGYIYALLIPSDYGGVSHRFEVPQGVDNPELYVQKLKKIFDKWEPNTFEFEHDQTHKTVVVSLQAK